MAERPILFSDPMVRAILAGQKTQTRRLITPQPRRPASGAHGADDPDLWLWRPFRARATHTNIRRTVVEERASGRVVSDETGHVSLEQMLLPHSPYGKPGDRLWVHETHAQFMVGEGEDSPVPQCVAYRASCEGDCLDYVNGRGEVLGIRVTRWTPSIFMPRWASRLTLEVTGVRVERLQDISEDDAQAEGIQSELVCPGGFDPDNFHPPGATGYVSGRHPFPKGSIYPTAGEAFREGWDAINGKRATWESNPWVWVVSFQRVERP